MSELATEVEPAPARPWRRRFARLVSACVIMELALLLFAWALPFRAATDSSIYHVVAPVSFFVRVFQLHAGVLALVAAVALFLLKSRPMALLALMVAIVGIVPEAWHAYGPRPLFGGGSDGKSLRVASINLLRHLSDVEPAAKVIDDFAADIVSVQEITPTHAAVLSSRLATQYPYQIVRPDEGFNGLAIYSRYPLTLEQDGGPEGLRWLRAAVHVDQREVEFYAIHLESPQRINKQRIHRWQVGRILKGTANEKRPIILAGDFNFTVLTPQAVALRKAGFVDTHYAHDRGRGTTWPTRVGSRVVPEVRIDTVYVKGNITARSSEVGPRFGSDHKPIVVDLLVK